MRLRQCTFPEEIQKRIFYIPVEPEFLTSQEQLIKEIHNYARKDQHK